MFNPDLDFYIPRTKKELIEKLERFYPGRLFSYMKVKQLKAIYIKTRQAGKVMVI